MTSIRTRAILCSSVATIFAAVPSSFGALVTYVADPNTIQLWHLDEPAGSGQASGLGLVSGTAFTVDANPAAVLPPVVTNVLGAPSFAGFGQAANFTGLTDHLLGFDTNLSGAYDGDITGTLSADQIGMSTLGLGGTSPFTLEAMVNPANVAGNREIIATDSTGATRGFQFRLTTGGTTGQRLEFNFIGSAGGQRFAEVPITGDHAFTLNSWFHAALTFDGVNAQFYWTKVDSNYSLANAIGTPQALTLSEASGSITGPLTFGNENRNVAGEGVNGLLDEIRISNIARSATQFIFAPATGSFWNNAGSGNWDTAGNWTAGVPNAAGAVASLGGGGTDLTAAATITIDGARTIGALTFNNANFGFSLVAGAAGSLNLDNGASPANVTVTAGGHAIGVPMNLPAAGAVFAVANGPDRLIIASAITGTGPFTKSGAGTLEIVDGGSLPATDLTINAGTLAFNRTAPFTLANNLSGGGALAQNGTAAMTVTGANTHSGGNIVNSGTLIVGSPTALGAATGPLTVNGGVLDANGNQLTIGELSGAGGVITDLSSAAGVTTLTIGGAIPTTFSGTIVDGSTRTLALVRNGTNILTLNSANTYSGGTTINSGGVAAAQTGVFGSGPITLGPGAARIVVGDGVNITNPITMNAVGPGVGIGAIQGSGIGTATVSGPITITAGSTSGGHFAGGGGVLQLNGAITAIAAPVVVRLGTVVFSGGGSYELIQLTDQPRIGAHNGLSTIAVADMAVSGAVTLDLNGFNQTLAGLVKTNATAATVVNFGGNASTLTLTPSAPRSYNGSITGNIALTINGSSTQTLAGTNDYTGPTVIQAGTLAVTGSISGTESITVAAGATLDVTGIPGGLPVGFAQTMQGNGTVLGGSLISGTLRPGAAAIGTLSFTGDLTLNGAATHEIAKAGVTLSSDLATVSGNLTLGGVLNVTATGDTLVSGDTFNLFDAAVFAGTFSAFNLPALLGDLEWDTSKLGIDGTVSVVPEPASGILLLGGLALVTRRRGGWFRTG